MSNRYIWSGWAAVSILLAVSVVAEEPAPEPPALKAAKARYQSESQEALAPVQKRYRTKLEAAQRELARKGDRKAAAAVKAELDRLGRGEADRVSSAVEGTWVVRYEGGLVRTYTIREDGTVLFVEEQRAGRTFREGDDWLLDFNDGKLERLTLKPAIRVEHFNPKGAYLTGRPTVTGMAEKEKPR